MDLQEVLAALKKGENGDAMAAVIEGEMSRLAGEAGRYRRSNRDASEKVKNLLEALGLDDGDDVVEQAKGLKSTLDSFAQGGKKPNEVAKQIADMTKQVTTLTKGNAASPQSMAKLIIDNLTVGDDEAIGYRDGDKDMTVEEGVNAWLSANAWAVKANPQAGGGSSAGGSGGADDPFLAGLKMK